VALAGVALFVVNSRQNGDVTLTEVAQVSQDKAASVSILVGGLEARLEASPEDAKGWILLARSYDHLGEHDKAWNAYARARDLGTTDTSLELKLATHVVSTIEQ
jgi:cytochrome c-type biogenesis protein CcmH/NrfG